MLRSPSRLFPFIVAFLLASSPLCAKADGEASLTVRLGISSTQFKVGQTIPLELIFSASEADTYTISMAGNDRSGRIGADQFEVTPKGRDPLHAYYYNPLQVHTFGGLSSSVPLGKEPQTLRRDLNEWVALDKPGRYSLRVLSSRVHQAAKALAEPNWLASNVLTFDIVGADPTWQREVVSKAVHLLDNPGTPQEDRDRAERTIRYLDCPESIHELARQITKPGQEDQWNFTAGLLGARDQTLVRRELEGRFKAPDAALTQNYLWLLSQAHFSHTHQPLPPYPLSDVREQERWQNKRAQLMTESMQADDLLYQRAVDTLMLKSAAAKAATVATLLLRPDGPHKSIQPSAAEIASSFPLLDPQQQATILQVFPSRVSSPWMAGPLEAILDKLTLSPDSSLRTLALRTLFTVSPERGRERILAEIRHPSPDILNDFYAFANCLSQLPDETLPEMDKLLASRLEKESGPSQDLDAELIGRYSTRAILGQVKAIGSRKAEAWNCTAIAGLMHYFQRWDEEYAKRWKASGRCTTDSPAK